MKKSKQPRFHFKLDGQNLKVDACDITPIEIAAALHTLATGGKNEDELFRRAILMAASELVEDTNHAAHIALIQELRK